MRQPSQTHYITTTHNLNPENLESLQWFASQGGRFCKVSPWNDSGDSPGKKPIEKGWQNKPYTLGEIMPDIRSGGNVGLLCGSHSGNIGLLDIDENFSGFLAEFETFASTPTIVRDGADKGKILIRIDGEMPGGKKWKHNPTDEHPFMEWLSNGNQGVIPPSIHPSKAPYKLSNSGNSIPTFTPEEMNAICQLWGGSPLMYFDDDEPELPTNLTKPAKREYPNSDGLRELVLEAWNPLQVFTHFGRVKKTRWEGDWLRLFGNGGLFVHRDMQGWNLVGVDGIGGGAFEAWWYCTHGDCNVPKDGCFYDLLLEMATEAGIDIPQIASQDTPGEAQSCNEDISSRIKIRDASYALQEQPPVQFIVDRLFSPGSVSLIVGPPGIGKTYAMLHCGVCVALEKPWLDMKTRRVGVLIIDEESGDRRMARRLGEVLRGEFGNGDTPIKYISLAQFNLREPGDAILLQAAIEESGAGLVLIDALADIMPGGDENAVKDVQPIFMRLRKIAEETGSGIVLIHHANKAGDYRGSTAISGAVDLLLMVDGKSGSKYINFEVKKARDVEPFKFSAMLHFSDNQVWLSSHESQERPRLGKAQEYVIRYLLQQGATTITGIANHADTCSDGAARKAVYNLASLEMVGRVDGGGPGEKATYDLTKNGKEYASALQLGGWVVTNT